MGAGEEIWHCTPCSAGQMQAHDMLHAPEVAACKKTAQGTEMERRGEERRGEESIEADKKEEKKKKERTRMDRVKPR